MITSNKTSMRVVVIGCGNIASFYCSSMPHHPSLKLAGVMDIDDSRATAYANYYSVPKYADLAAVLNDKTVDLIINVTNPRSHFPVSKACLEAGKHVYSEKPLAMSFPDAKHLVELAERKGLTITSAPSRILAETAQTMAKALREKAIGKVHAIYAEMDGGLIYRSTYKEWVNEVGMHWPYKDELEVGCTIEHAGYPVSWLTAFFGPVETVTGFATCQIPDLQTDVPLDNVPPDLTVACLKFKSGPVARLTSSWIAPHDHSIRIFGDTGVLKTADVWEPRCPVYITRHRKFQLGPKSVFLPWNHKCPMVGPASSSFTSSIRKMPRSPREIFRALRSRFLHLKERVDFCIGPAEVAASLFERRPCRLSHGYCLHNTEVVLAIHNSLQTGTHHKITTTFEPMDPMPWAQT